MADKNISIIPINIDNTGYIIIIIHETLITANIFDKNNIIVTTILVDIKTYPIIVKAATINSNNILNIFSDIFLSLNLLLILLKKLFIF